MEHVRDAPQQSNGFDCGMYTVLLARRLASSQAAAAAAATTAVASAPPAVMVEAEAAVAATVVAVDQDRDAVVVGGEAAEGGIGCGGGGGGGGGDYVGAPVANDWGRSGEGSGAREVGMNISPEFVSNERTLARERLLRCIRNQGGR